ncbi:hypothetical protein Syun_021986 [Stephania yunnanensis]|uniref:FAD-binding PCMH-type domain-containing protein n=1 Tax=Stephania yunnanensis TaxID=152371 RepID=A0AAP0IGM1_9MAGN
MGNPSYGLATFLTVFVLTIFCATSSSPNHESFINCLAFHSQSNSSVYTPETPSYSTILQSSIQNLRFETPETRKPEFIVTPSHESQVQTAVICCRKHGLQIRVRSGGHDFEGLSYASKVPFVMIDLINLRSVEVDIGENSAWVQAGATIGEVYYRIAEKSRIHGFPGGLCPHVGVGGHISGAGYGNLLRKYGVSADHVVDALIINTDGKILDRESMGEDLFWAIRGGGAASFGVILAWKIQLVPVPPTVTVSTVDRTLEQGATALVQSGSSSLIRFKKIFLLDFILLR